MQDPGFETTVLAFAAQTGRLDFISVVLAVLVIVLALSAFPLFFFVQHRAEKVAKREAETALKNALEQIENTAISRIEQMLPGMIQDYHDLAVNAVSDIMADQIAAAQEDRRDDEVDH